MEKKIILLLLALFLNAGIHSVAVNVSGTITTNTTWNLAGSPYVVTSTVTVNPGVTLTVESGVQVKFVTGQSLLVHGTMNATGAVFTSNNVTPVPGDWQNIRVGNSPVADSGIVIMNSCQVLYSNYVYVMNGRAQLTNTDILNSNTYGIYVVNTSKLLMTGGMISSNSSTASASGSAILQGVGSRATLSGVTLQNFFYGINTSGTVSIHNHTTTNCKWPFSLTATSQMSTSGTNFFTGNINNAAYIDFSTLGTTMTLPYLAIPYFIPGTLTVNSTGKLIIASGNILKFQIGYGLTINGKLRAEASPGEFIYFTSYRDDNWGGDTNADGSTTAPAVSNWPGIRFQDSSIDTANLLRRCKIRYAGSSSAGGVTMVDASPTVDQCDISNSYFGAYISQASNPVFSYNTIGSSSMTPIAMSFEANPVTISNTFSFSDNAYDAIGLIGGTLTSDATIIKRNVTGINNITYVMLSSITIPAGKSLTINKGIVLKGLSGSTFFISGTLNAIATADSMITFTSTKDDNHGNPGDTNKDGTITFPIVGDWGGFLFYPGGAGTLDFCRIKYSNLGSNAFTNCSTTEYVSGCAVGMIDASPVISNCEFKDLNNGISAYRASNPVISNNAMINISNTPFNLSGAADPVFTGNTFTNVKYRALGLIGGRVCQNGTIKKRNVAGYTNITYMLISTLSIMPNTYLNVEPGVVIKSSSEIYVEGGFKTDGTLAEKVTFTCLTDDNEGNPMDTNGDGSATAPSAGCGMYVWFRGSSDDTYCNINHTRIKYPATYGLYFENAAGQVNNTLITNGSAYGLYFTGNSAPQINTTIIQNCSSDPLAMSLLSNPVFSNITFTANGSNAIRIIDATLSSAAQLYPRNVAGITNIAYRIGGSLNIFSNGSLTIEPGVVLKFESSSNIIVSGQFKAKGLPGNKIYFTSFHDDSKGGDSNNNGTGSSPSWGQWGYVYQCISFSNSMQDTLVNCELSYGTHGFGFYNSSAYIKDCLIQQMSGFGMQIYGSSSPEFNTCSFYNINKTPVQMAMFSNPTFTNITALNVGYMALDILAETYSQNATIPIRNFAGYNNITYKLSGACTVNSGTTVTIPAGVVFKHTGTAFNVNGRLNVLGTVSNPVVFTTLQDDAVGNPPDTYFNGNTTPSISGNGYILLFNDVSNDSSMVEYTHLKYCEGGVGLISASPVINHVTFEKLNTGIGLSGVSTPKIDNSLFHNLLYYPLVTSLLSFPSSLMNNSISGSTYRVITVQNETLTQDVTLPKRSFGGINNIPYLFGNYTIGTAATLTIEPGVVCKFAASGGMIVNKGLIAEGGLRADSNIVFTSIKDDFYGGDSNADSNATSPARANWNNIRFEDQSLDPFCRLKNCIIRYSDNGIYTVSASPTILLSSITKSTYGCYATAASNPVFSQCDFDDNYYFAINNVNKTFTINATNCWWGSNLGPIQTNTAGNGTSVRELVTTSVNYTPFSTTGTTSPLMGDVSLNGQVQAYDASLVLQYVVGSTSLSPVQLRMGDVSFAAGVTAYDASLILQYVVGLISYFPAELLKPVFTNLAEPQLVIGQAQVMNGDVFAVPVRVVNDIGMLSADVVIGYDPSYLEILNVITPLGDMQFNHAVDPSQGRITLALAGTSALSSDTTLAYISMRAISPTGMDPTPLTAEIFLANEQDYGYLAVPGSVTIGDLTTGTSGDLREPGRLAAIAPNPTAGDSWIQYQVNGATRHVTIDIFTITGQKVATLVDEPTSAGSHSVSLVGEGVSLTTGMYLVKMTTDGFVKSAKLVVK